MARKTVIAQAFGPFSIVGTRHFIRHGQRVPVAGQTLELARLPLHELGTNAAKYGALSMSGGKVTLAWRVAPQDLDGQESLHLEWRETGGPPTGAVVRMTLPAEKLNPEIQVT